MNYTKTPYAKTGKFSSLVLDYLNKNESIVSFFGNSPELDGMAKQVEIKTGFSNEFRQKLVRQLQAQYAGLSMTDDVRQNIDALADANTFTVTTGHQLCLFTGPLYSVYKILHVISLAQKLNTDFPEKHLVPVFWMASEDHDFDEVNHVKIGAETLVWNAESGDGVGRITTEKIHPLIDELSNKLPKGNNADDLINDLKAAYSKKNLAAATRDLVNKWFGKYGLVVIDGDDVELKKAMIPAFEKELLENTSYNCVSKTNQKLSAHYKIQVTPREINLFYLEGGHRGRIEKVDSNYTVVDRDLSWSESEILDELRTHPERFSPNVLLRPLYQETILPNIAYIGGGGEVAYWAQLKDMFAAFNVPFPIVVLRQSVQISPKRIDRKRQKLDLTYEELFKPEHEITTAFVKRQRNFEAEMAPIREAFRKLHQQLENIATSENPDFKRTVFGQQTMLMKRLDHLEKRLIRSAKKKDTDRSRMLHEIKVVLQPGGGLQERKDNIVPFLAEYGKSLFDAILQAIDPLNFEFITLHE